jgi:hypothetical protein
VVSNFAGFGLTPVAMPDAHAKRRDAVVPTLSGAGKRLTAHVSGERSASDRRERLERQLAAELQEPSVEQAAGEEAAGRLQP